MSAFTTMTLRARSGIGPLDPSVRDMVVAAAHAIAERTGLPVAEVSADGEQVTVRVQGPPIVAIGFVAELRRVTDRWYEGKYGGVLWGEAP